MRQKLCSCLVHQIWQESCFASKICSSALWILQDKTNVQTEEIHTSVLSSSRSRQPCNKWKMKIMEKTAAQWSRIMIQEQDDGT